MQAKKVREILAEIDRRLAENDVNGTRSYIAGVMSVIDEETREERANTGKQKPMLG